MELSPISKSETNSKTWIKSWDSDLESNLDLLNESKPEIQNQIQNQNDDLKLMKMESKPKKKITRIKDLEFDKQEKLLKKDKKEKKLEQIKIIENSKFKSWTVLRSLQCEYGKFYFTDHCFTWSAIPLDKLNNNIHVVGIDIGKIHLGICGLSDSRKLIYFSLSNTSKMISSQLKVKTSSTKEKEKSDTDFDSCIKVIDLILSDHLLAPLWNCNYWLVENQYGTFFDGKTKTKKAGNVEARMISCAIQNMLFIANIGRKDNNKIYFGNVFGGAKYGIAPALVKPDNQFLKNHKYDQSVKGSSKSKERKIIGQFHAFALMEHFGDEALSVLQLIEENIVSWSSKKVDKDELDKIYDITDSYLIAQRKWFEKDDKIKRKISYQKRKLSLQKTKKDNKEEIHISDADSESKIDDSEPEIVIVKSKKKKISKL